MNDKILKKLHSADMFRHIEPEMLQKILSSSRTVLRHYEKGRTVMLRGDAVCGLIMLLEGRLIAHINSLKGKMLRIEVLKAPAPVASGILYAEDNRLPVSLLAETNADLLIIPADTVITLCQKSRDFMQSYFTDMGTKISILAEKIRLYQFNTIRQKIAGYLLGLSGPRQLDSVKLVYSKEILAEMMGVTRPALSREFSHLAEEGIIETNGKKIRIADRRVLEDIIFED